MQSAGMQGGMPGQMGLQQGQAGMMNQTGMQQAQRTNQQRNTVVQKSVSIVDFKHLAQAESGIVQYGSDAVDQSIFGGNFIYSININDWLKLTI